MALVGVAGYGGILLAQIEILRARGRLQLAAVVAPEGTADSRLLTRLDGHGCRVYPQLEAMLRAEAAGLDLCLLPTPLHLHRAMTEQVLAAGVNVLVEKPAAPTLQEVDAMTAAAARADRLAAVGFQDLYAPEIQRLKRLLLAGGLGRVSSLRALVLWPRDDAYYRRNAWAGRLRAGADWVLDSPLNNAAAHYLMLMLFLAGRTHAEAATPVEIEGELRRAREIESFDTAAVRYHLADGKTLLMLATHSGRDESAPVIAIEGTGGRAVWQFERGVTISRADCAVEHWPAADMMGARLNMIDRTLAHLDDPAVFVCRTELARSHTFCINALHDHVPITTLAPEWLLRADDAGRTEIRDVDAAFGRCWQENLLPAEAGVPWARANARARLDGYAGFAGRLHAATLRSS